MAIDKMDGRERGHYLAAGHGMSRRQFLRRTLAGMSGIAGLTATAGCDLSLPDFTAPESTPVPTPADVPAMPTPAPEATPTPEIQPTPEPTPEPEPVEQILRVSGAMPDAMETGLPEGIACPIHGGVASGLLRSSEGFTVEADWAESWSPRADGSIWVFRLRQNAGGWENGDPVTASDIVTSWKRFLDPDLSSGLAWMLYDIEAAREVHSGELAPEDLGAIVWDDLTLEVRLLRPRYSLTALLASPLFAPFLGPEALESENQIAEDAVELCPSSGPFRVEDASEEGLALVRNDNHWDSDSITLERIDVAFHPAGRAFNDFRSGAADVIPVESGELGRVRADATISSYLRQLAPNRVWILIPQVDLEPFDDVRVRRIIARVIDRQRISVITEGRVIPATAAAPDWMFNAFDGSDPAEPLGFDVDRALEDLEEAGLTDPSAWPALVIPVPEGDELLLKCTEDIALQLFENLGLEVEVTVLPRDELQAGVTEGLFALSWVDWVYRYPDPASIYGDLFSTLLNPDRPLFWQDQGYDELVRLADSLSLEDERTDAYARCDEYLQDRAIYIPMLHPVEYALIQPWVENVPEIGPGFVSNPGLGFAGIAASVSIGPRS